ncbi:MAG: cytochrome c family protein [Gammaproteobacteria bacterium]|nr:cytochrome c family protein [Gammaproteobacteria bacterium]
MPATIPGIGLTLLVVLALAPGARAADEPPYDGRKKCTSCHKSQYRSWQETGHGRAMQSLAPGEKADAKRKAGLDPDEDYTQNIDCVGCHTTGYGHEGGYDIDDPDKYLVNVTCESCHGPGSEYRLLHRKYGERFEKSGEPTPRAVLAEAGQEFEFAERCNACHMNYEGSPWPGAAEPYTPFTPGVDPKYAFDFEKSLRDDGAMHAHFKLDGTFTGPPVPSFHDEFQSTARPLDEQ